MIKRFYDLGALLATNKVLVIYGPRRSGKTTLLNDFLQKTELKYRLVSGEDINVQEILGSQDFDKIKEYVGDFELIAIDEAQNVKGIGMGLKIMADNIPGLKIIAAGSSSFDLANQAGEPLVGRKKTITIFPLAQMELARNINTYDLKQKIDDFLIYGSYPEVYLLPSKSEKIDALNEIANSYLLKDVLALDNVKKSKTLVDLVKLLALQTGNEVSLNEISAILGVNLKTVEKYLDILEKGFVIVSLGALKRNLRNEIRGKKKYYFFDNGVRNALLNQFNDVGLRNDVGALWENFLFIERMKKREYANIYANAYFWRTYQQKEIDLIEEYGGVLHGYEFKYGAGAAKSKEFLAAYPGATVETINRQNYAEFVM